MSDVETLLAEKAQALHPGSFRHTVLLAARRFKSTWVELGKLLVKVRDQASYEGWGYPTFEAYCAQELHIRKQTALKLTRSFSFLHKHEPKQLLSEDLAERVPAFEIVEVLADAEERGQMSSAEYRAIRDSRQIARAARRLVSQLEGCRSVPQATVQRADALAQELEELAHPASE